MEGKEQVSKVKRKVGTWRARLGGGENSLKMESKKTESKVGRWRVELKVEIKARS